MTGNEPTELRIIYQRRFEKMRGYRKRVWEVLIREKFQACVKPDATVLDLGCGYGEFINQIRCGKKYGMDLNPDSRGNLAPDVELIEQDCSKRWPFSDGTLDVIFTSNFFEHLPGKAALKATLDEAHRCLKPGGRLIAIGPNIKYLPGSYWDFWDHHLPLTELSLSEGLTGCGFTIRECVDRFLPYTMVNARQHPPIFVSLYLRLPIVWRFFGRQFLIIASKEIQGQPPAS
jgi:SAM-dependent methyltransferase